VVSPSAGSGQALSNHDIYGLVNRSSPGACYRWAPSWFALSFTLLLLGGVAQAGFSTMQSTILLLASLPQMRGRIVGASGTVNGLGHLFGGWETGVIASAFNIGLAISLNAGAAQAEEPSGLKD